MGNELPQCVANRFVNRVKEELVNVPFDIYLPYWTALIC